MKIENKDIYLMIYQFLGGSILFLTSMYGNLKSFALFSLFGFFIMVYRAERRSKKHE